MKGLRWRWGALTRAFGFLVYLVSYLYIFFLIL
jgi:hypothetical protein